MNSWSNFILVNSKLYCTVPLPGNRLLKAYIFHNSYTSYYKKLQNSIHVMLSIGILQVLAEILYPIFILKSPIGKICTFYFLHFGTTSVDLALTKNAPLVHKRENRKSRLHNKAIFFLIKSVDFYRLSHPRQVPLSASWWESYALNQGFLLDAYGYPWSFGNFRVEIGKKKVLWTGNCLKWTLHFPQKLKSTLMWKGMENA